jgi:hypothetical protein
MKFALSCFLIGLSISGFSQKLSYKSKNLTLTKNYVKDSLRTIEETQLPKRTVKNAVMLKADASPMTKSLWNVALADIENNIVSTDRGQYFGAGKDFGVLLYTRDISYSGILGVSQFYPDLVLKSLKITREVHLDLKFKVPKDYVIPSIKVDWQPLDLYESQFVEKYKTNNYIRRTDDVVWMWAAYDLFKKHPEKADWKWLHEYGNKCYETLYMPFFDKTDGLFRGQASFIDIHYSEGLATGYPADYTKADCVLIKALSTNCLYYKSLLVMAETCREISRVQEALEWEYKAEKLKEAIRKNLMMANGNLAYFKDKNGKLHEKIEALGSAMAILFEIQSQEEAKKSLENLKTTWVGTPLLQPFFEGDKPYHNNSSWPYVDTFMLMAKEKIEGKDYTGLNAALLARTCVKNKGFHEVVNFSTRQPFGSGGQLWSAASFVNVCLRAGLVEGLGVVKPNF